MVPHDRSDARRPDTDDWGRQADPHPSDDPTQFAGPAETMAPPAKPTALPPLKPGQVLGPYRLVERLGAGGMGEVFKAVHQTMNRVVALKVLAPHLVEDNRARRRFKREVLSTSKLSHPNIVIAHDAAETDGYCYLVMEFVDGIDLGDLVQMIGLPPAHVACQIIKQAAEALQHAGDQGLIHRDIKPANLMVLHTRGPSSAGSDVATREACSLWPDPPTVKLLDFGLVRMEAPADAPRPPHGLSVTREGVVVGTPEYMAPEQATHGGKVDVRSDIYALGCTFYFLLSGKAPFNTGTVYDILAAQIRLKPEPLSRKRTDLPAGLVAVVDKMLAKRPEDRYQTPAEVAVALEPWTTARAVPAPSTTAHVSLPPESEATQTLGHADADGSERTIPILPTVRVREKPQPVPTGLTVGAFFALVALVAVAAMTMWALTRPSSLPPDDPPITSPKDKDVGPPITD